MLKTTALGEWLGDQIKAARIAAGLTQNEAAAALDITPRTLLRHETGESKPDVKRVELMVDVYAIRDQARRSDLIAAAADEDTAGWWRQHNDILNPSYAAFIEVEQDATTIDCYSSDGLPPLAQTEDYATAILTRSIPLPRSEHADRFAAIRTERRHRVYNRRNVQLTFLMDATVLERLIGTPQIMADQMQHLINLTTDGRAAVRLVPTDTGHWLVSPSMTLMQHPRMGTYTSIFNMNDASDDNSFTSTYPRRAYDYLLSRSLDQADTLAQLERMATYYQSRNPTP